MEREEFEEKWNKACTDDYQLRMVYIGNNGSFVVVNERGIFLDDDFISFFCGNFSLKDIMDVKRY